MVTACRLEFMPPLVRPIVRPLWSPGPLFPPHTGRRAVRLRIGRIDHLPLRNGGFASQTIDHPSEGTFVAPLLPLIQKVLRRSISPGCIGRLPPIVIDEDYAAQHTFVIDVRLTVALRKEGLQPCHLRVAQPREVAHDPVSLRSLKQVASARPMGPDPGVQPH